jgi:hypothetical protein
MVYHVLRVCPDDDDCAKNSPQQILVWRPKPTLAGHLGHRLIVALPTMFDAGKAERKVATEEGAYDGPPKDGHRIGTDQFAYKGHAGVFQDADDVLAHEVEVFLAHFGHLGRG